MLADTPLAPYYEKANLGNGLVASFLLDEMQNSISVDLIWTQEAIWSGDKMMIIQKYKYKLYKKKHNTFSLTKFREKLTECSFAFR